MAQMKGLMGTTYSHGHFLCFGFIALQISLIWGTSLVGNTIIYGTHKDSGSFSTRCAKNYMELSFYHHMVSRGYEILPPVALDCSFAFSNSTLFSNSTIGNVTFIVLPYDCSKHVRLLELPRGQLQIAEIAVSLIYPATGSKGSQIQNGLMLPVCYKEKTDVFEYGVKLFDAETDIAVDHFPFQVELSQQIILSISSEDKLQDDEVLLPVNCWMTSHNDRSSVSSTQDNAFLVGGCPIQEIGAGTVVYTRSGKVGFTLAPFFNGDGYIVTVTCEFLVCKVPVDYDYDSASVEYNSDANSTSSGENLKLLCSPDCSKQTNTTSMFRESLKRAVSHPILSIPSVDSDEQTTIIPKISSPRAQCSWLAKEIAKTLCREQCEKSRAKNIPVKYVVVIGVAAFVFGVLLVSGLWGIYARAVRKQVQDVFDSSTTSDRILYQKRRLSESPDSQRPLYFAEDCSYERTVHS